MNTLSIVIPATGSQAEIDDTLLSILENRPSDCEILLVHDPSYVDPYDLQDEVRFVEFEGSGKVPDSARRLEFLNAGFQQCQGDIIHTLVPGLTVGSDWCESALQMFDDTNIGSVAPYVIAKKNRLTIQGIAYHSGRGKRIITNDKQPVVAPLLGTGFYRASCMQFMRGFEVRFGPYADIELGLRMKAARYKAVSCDSRIYKRDRIRFRPVFGFRGGKLRGDLHQLALHVGLTTTGRGLFGLASEPLNNGWTAVGALVGRLVGHFGRTPANVLRMGSDPMEVDREEDRRAA